MATAPQDSEHRLESHDPETKSMITALVPHGALYHGQSHVPPEHLVKAMATPCQDPPSGKRYTHPSPRTHTRGIQGPQAGLKA